MRTLGIVLGVIVGGIAVLVAVYEFGYTHRYRYRLTLEVEADGQVKTGSGVIQVTSRLDFVPGRPLKFTTTFSGEAVYVDLGPRGNLFALLTSQDGFNAAYLPSKAFFPHGGAGTDYVQGGGFKSQLFGGDGSGTPDTTPDVFGLSNHSFVMDATSDDFVTWGSWLLTGGVQQWWMEKGWAYWTPFTSIVSTISPLGFLDTFGALAAILDSPTRPWLKLEVSALRSSH
jgi:hypothetical protein